MSHGKELAAMLAGAVASVVCAMFTTIELASAESPGASTTPLNTGRAPGRAFLMDLTRGYDPENHVLARWDAVSDWMAASYRLSNIVYGSDGLRLTTRISRNDVSDYTSAEFQRAGYFGYGRYEVVMRATSAPGVVASFFIHTDEDMGDPHDEIDFELLGRSPRQAHLNYFADGANNPVDVDLGFDASAGEHLYAFEWSPGAIVWYVDGIEVRRVVAGPGVSIPTTSGRVIANVWAANRSVVEWTGKPTVESATAVYRCMSHIPLGGAGRQCSDSFASPRS